MQDLASSTLAHAGSFIASGGYAHLYFATDSDLWTVLLH
jgi:hypothetical protein